jgi:hypothetical protein
MFFSTVREMQKIAENYKLAFFTYTITLFFSAGLVSAQDMIDYGPRFEIGIGGSFSQEYKTPQWTSASYNSTMISGAIRLYDGLAIQGGVGLGRGGKPYADSLSYGKDYILNPDKGTYNTTSWIGLRYELPMRVLKKDIVGIHSIYICAGVCKADYGVRSTSWIYNGNLFVNQSITSFRFSELNGQYASLAARWRIDTGEGENHGSWLGSYGLDLGIKYTRYQDIKPELPDLEKAVPGFNNLQIFVTGFLKFRLFE